MKVEIAGDNGTLKLYENGDYTYTLESNSLTCAELFLGGRRLRTRIETLELLDLFLDLCQLCGTRIVSATTPVFRQFVYVVASIAKCLLALPS